MHSSTQRLAIATLLIDHFFPVRNDHFYNSSYPIGSISEVAPELLKLFHGTYTMGPAIGALIEFN